MTSQYWFIDCNQCITFFGVAEVVGGMGREDGLGGKLSVFSTQFCCEPKALRKWSLLKKYFLNQKSSWIQLLPIFICYPGFTYNLTILWRFTLMAFQKEARFFPMPCEHGFGGKILCSISTSRALLSSPLPNPFSLNEHTSRCVSLFF